MISSFSGKHRFLSNFWPVQVTLENVKYPSVEHAFVAAKTEDIDFRSRVRFANTPAVAKKMGREILLRPNWENLRLHFMEIFLYEKFSYPYLRKWLLETGEEELIEGNNWGDKFWGQVNGIGENHLGRLLMEIREEIK